MSRTNLDAYVVIKETIFDAVESALPEGATEFPHRTELLIDTALKLLQEALGVTDPDG